MHTLNAETAPAYPEVAASGECRSNPTNHERREVDSMMSHATDTGRQLNYVANLVSNARCELKNALDVLPDDAPLFAAVDIVAALDTLSRVRDQLAKAAAEQVTR